MLWRNVNDRATRMQKVRGVLSYRGEKVTTATHPSLVLRLALSRNTAYVHMYTAAGCDLQSIAQRCCIIRASAVRLSRETKRTGRTSARVSTVIDTAPNLQLFEKHLSSQHSQQRKKRSLAATEPSVTSQRGTGRTYSKQKRASSHCVNSTVCGPRADCRVATHLSTGESQRCTVSTLHSTYGVGVRCPLSCL